MVSGRGLGITGGTLDKLESIPGFNVKIGICEAIAQLGKIGVVMMGQTDRFCPADKKLYALRDVTGTVPSIPLITASIMSKKLAESLDKLVLDVKYGSGAFMQTKADAEKLAASMIAVGKEMDVEVMAILNPMSEPTGCAVGNVLEVIEALECLDGGGPADLREVVLDLSVAIAGVERAELAALLDDGTARKLFDRLVDAPGRGFLAAWEIGGSASGAVDPGISIDAVRGDFRSGRGNDRAGVVAIGRGTGACDGWGGFRGGV